MIVGFVGLGRMGNPMAANLAGAGFRVIAYDQDAGALRRLSAATGCTEATDPADFAPADAVVTMLPNGRIVREVMLDWAGGIGGHLRAGSAVVDMSSSDPIGTRELGERLGQLDVVLVDAPVSGGVPKAADGTLSIMLGGDDDGTIARVLPVIEAMSARIFRTGTLGSGHAMKALNNFVAAAGFAAGCEAINAGKAFGLDPAVMVDVLNASTGRSFNTETTFVDEVLTGRYATGFALGLMTKDVGIAADLTEGVGVPAPLCALVADRLREAAGALGDGSDFSAAIDHWAKA